MSRLQVYKSWPIKRQTRLACSVNHSQTQKSHSSRLLFTLLVKIIPNSCWRNVPSSTQANLLTAFVKCCRLLQKIIATQKQTKEHNGSLWCKTFQAISSSRLIVQKSVVWNVKLNKLTMSQTKTGLISIFFLFLNVYVHVLSYPIDFHCWFITVGVIFFLYTVSVLFDI